MKATVLDIFQDKITKAYYSVGQQIEIADASRLADLETRGLVKVVETVEDKPAKKVTRKFKEA